MIMMIMGINHICMFFWIHLQPFFRLFNKRLTTIATVKKKNIFLSSNLSSETKKILFYFLLLLSIFFLRIDDFLDFFIQMIMTMKSDTHSHWKRGKKFSNLLWLLSSFVRLSTCLIAPVLSMMMVNGKEEKLIKWWWWPHTHTRNNNNNKLSESFEDYFHFFSMKKNM